MYRSYKYTHQYLHIKTLNHFNKLHYKLDLSIFY